MAEYLVSIFHICEPIYRLIILTFFKFYALIKLRVSISLWFSQELLNLSDFFRGVHPIDLSINISIVDCGVFIP